MNIFLFYLPSSAFSEESHRLSCSVFDFYLIKVQSAASSSLFI